MNFHLLYWKINMLAQKPLISHAWTQTCLLLWKESYLSLPRLFATEEKWFEVKWKSVSRVWLFAMPWTVCSLPGSSVHGILQARILGWVAMSSSRASSQPRDRTQVPRIAGGFFTILAKVIWSKRAVSGLTWETPHFFHTTPLIHVLNYFSGFCVYFIHISLLFKIHR